MAFWTSNLQIFVGSCRSLIHFSSNGDSNRWLWDFSVLWTETREKILPGSVTVSTKWYPTKQGCWRLLNKEGHWPAPDMKHIEDTGSLMTLHLFIFAIFFKLISDLCICFLTWLCSYPSAHDNMDAGLCKLQIITSEIQDYSINIWKSFTWLSCLECLAAN